MDLQEVGWGMDWIGLAHDRDRRWALVNAKISRPAAKNAGFSLTS